VGLFNLMVLYDQSGHPEHRDGVATHIVALAEQLDEPLTWNTAQVFLELGRQYERAGHPRATVILYRQAHRYMMERADVALDTRVAWLEMYARSLSNDGQDDQALQIYRDAVAAAELLDHGRDGTLMRINGTMAGILRRNGSLDTAAHCLERGRDIAESSDERDSDMAGAIYHNLASLYLQLRRAEQYAEAERLTLRSLSIVEQGGRGVSGEYACGLGQLAAVFEAQGDPLRAVELYEESFSVFEAVGDTRHDDFAEFLTDAGFLHLQLRRPTEAVRVFDRALQLRLANGDPRSPSLANACSNLATAYFDAGELASASSLYGRAIELRLAHEGAAGRC
jgi:tetratricopeptide (TPR) repeat protein